MSEHIERLARLETDINYIKEVVQRLSATFEDHPRNTLRIEFLEMKVLNLEKGIVALDTDLDLMNKSHAQLEVTFNDFKAWMKARWWIAVAIVSICGTIGGVGIQLLIPLLTK